MGSDSSSEYLVDYGKRFIIFGNHFQHGTEKIEETPTLPSRESVFQIHKLPIQGRYSRIVESEKIVSQLPKA